MCILETISNFYLFGDHSKCFLLRLAGCRGRAHEWEEHEWEKHGMCSGATDAADYFSQNFGCEVRGWLER